MRILFINPPIQHAFALRGPNRVWLQYELAPPLGLMSLSAYVKRHGYAKVRLLNGQTPQGASDQEILSAARAYQPDVVGFTVNSVLYYNACRVASEIKKAVPATKIVFGGPHLTEYAVEAVQQPMVDFAVYGEGEHTFHELLQGLDGDREISSITGLVHKLPSGEVIKNPPRRVTEPLDALPMPDYSLYDYRQARIQFSSVGPTGIMITSRGCPFACTFCSRNYGYYRARSAESVVAEMLVLKHMGYRAIEFFDDSFNVSRERVLDICRLIRSRRVDLPWSFRGRVDKFDEHLAGEAAAAGCVRASFGVESGCQAVLDRIHKGTTVAQAREAFRNARHFGIETVAYFMLGLPGETRVEAEQTTALIRELRPDYLVLQSLVPQPGSPLYREAVAAGAFPDRLRDWARHPFPDLAVPAYEGPMSEQEIFALVRSSLVRFYTRPSFMARSLIKIRSLEDLRVKTRTALRLLGPLLRAVD
jgi:anaerobic magnesium-protoporphyrin IX monomethyl ester cyclase